VYPKSTPILKRFIDQATLAHTTLENLLSRFEFWMTAIGSNELITHFKLLLLNTRLPLPKTNGGVLILEKMESIGISKKIGFICGCCEDFWPQSGSKNIIPEAIRTHFEIPIQRDIFEMDYFIFSNLINQIQTELFFTRPETIKDQPKLPTHFFDRMQIEIQTIKYPMIPVRSVKESFKLDLENPDIKNRYEAACATYSDITDNPYFGELTQLKSIWQNKSTFSPTQLETYQSCPYRYFWKYIQKELGLPEVVEDVAAHIWGKLIHEILCTYNQNQQNDIIIVAKSILNKYKKDTLYWEIKTNLLLGNKESPGLIDLYCEEEKKMDIPLYPVACEYPFKIMLIHPKTNQTMQLQGQIDVILKKDPNWAIMDYKTGRELPTSKEIETLAKLQLPIYLLAMIHLGYKQAHCSGGIIYQLHNRTHFKKKVVLISENAKKNKIFNLGRLRPFSFQPAFFDQLTGHLFQLESWIQSGYFSRHPNIIPENRPCHICQYQLFCKVMSSCRR